MNLSYKEIIAETSKKIAPLWSLRNVIAVNPYLGFSHQDFKEVANIYAQRSSIKLTMPIDFYLKALSNGELTESEIQLSLTKNARTESVEEFLIQAKQIEQISTEHPKIITLIDFVEQKENLELHETLVDSISQFLSSYFDQFQAIWNTPSNQSIYKKWKEEAAISYLPEIKGIKGFRKYIKSIPQENNEAFEFVITELQLTEDQLESYLHTLLLKVSGWASYISGLDWNNKLYTDPTNLLEDLMIILLSWEFALFKSFSITEPKELWELNSFTEISSNMYQQNEKLMVELIFQDAYDLVNEKRMIQNFNQNEKLTTDDKTPKVQAVFCIDVRSEIIRRHIENFDPEIQTVGFAGFFGFPINYKPLGNSNGRNQCPALIASGPVVKETTADKNKLASVLKRKQSKNQFTKAFKYFKTGAISGYSYVSPMGMVYLPKLLKKSLSLGASKASRNSEIAIDLSEITLTKKVEMASSALTSMGLKDELAKIVMIVGHGSTSTNNLHASGLECGACGGNSGVVNALAAAEVLNDNLVRDALALKGISISDDTFFVAAMHDTTSDEITLYPHEDHPEIEHIKNVMSKASSASRTERSLKFKNETINSPDELPKRGSDWSQICPELGLAGCSSFVIGSRKLTSSLKLDGTTFLHDYNQDSDKELKVLEGIMTAPMIVSTWINLQYFSSVADQQKFGAGNKTLHNVTAGIGVIEGAGGDLKAGLPIQSVHDGKDFLHKPYRLSVYIEAKPENLNTIIAKHQNIKDLLDNNWISLFSINANGKVESKYYGDLNWFKLSESSMNIKKELDSSLNLAISKAQTFSVNQSNLNKDELKDALHEFIQARINFLKMQSMREWEKNQKITTEEWDKKVQSLYAFQDQLYAQLLSVESENERFDFKLSIEIEKKNQAEQNSITENTTKVKVNTTK